MYSPNSSWPDLGQARGIVLVYWSFSYQVEFFCFLYNSSMIPNFQPLCTKGARAEFNPNSSLLLRIPAGEEGAYRVAQLDDYHRLARTQFCWQPPIRLSLQARCSQQSAAGTWGFGFWNDPFSANLGLGGMSRRLPALPNCAWFFHASSSNHLEIYDRYPAEGFLAATFQSPLIPTLLLTPAFLLAPLLLIQPAARLLRKAARMVIKQDAIRVGIDVCDWHSYQIDWNSRSTTFRVDQQLIFETPHPPNGHLGLVIWVDNQFFAFPPSGKIRFGTLAQTEPTTLEINNLLIA